MRLLPPRPTLPANVNNRLARETADISAIADAEQMKAEAATRYSLARRATWFRPVLESLAQMTGEGQRCMCCSGSESAQVEHYRDKASYPESALQWNNFIWACGICNLAKGMRFDENCEPINPVDEKVWDYFFMDEFGNLCARWDPASDSLNLRAVETMLLYQLDRQALQETRFARLRELRTFVGDSLALKNAGTLNSEDLQERALAWHASPLQPDVADYFFNGPGQADPPFSNLFAEADL